MFYVLADLFYSLSMLAPTGQADQDRRAQKRYSDKQATGKCNSTDVTTRIEEELARLERNKERRIARDKQKGLIRGDAGDAGSPGSPGSTMPAAQKPVGTQRKCANCGQVGHIKTNKKCVYFVSSYPFI